MSKIIHVHIIRSRAQLGTKDSFGGPYKAAFDKIKNEIDEKYIGTLRLMLERMSNGMDESEALASVSFGAAQGKVKSMLQQYLSTRDAATKDGMSQAIMDDPVGNGKHAAQQGYTLAKVMQELSSNGLNQSDPDVKKYIAAFKSEKLRIGTGDAELTPWMQKTMAGIPNKAMKEKVLAAFNEKGEEYARQLYRRELLVAAESSDNKVDNEDGTSKTMAAYEAHALGKMYKEAGNSYQEFIADLKRQYGLVEGTNTWKLAIEGFSTARARDCQVEGASTDASFIEVLNDPRGKSLVEQIEEITVSLRRKGGKGSDPILENIAASLVKELKSKFNYSYGSFYDRAPIGVVQQRTFDAPVFQTYYKTAEVLASGKFYKVLAANKYGKDAQDNDPDSMLQLEVDGSKQWFKMRELHAGL